MDAADWRSRIESDPRVLHGKPCIKGTRIPVALILGYVASGRRPDEIMRLMKGLREFLTQHDDATYHRGKLFVIEPHRIRIRS